MILLRRLNGTEIGVNADLIERVESTPDTVITLIDGTKYVVAEPAAEVVARIVEFRARILAAAETFTSEGLGGAAYGGESYGGDAGPRRADHVVPLRLVQSQGNAEIREI